MSDLSVQTIDGVLVVDSRLIAEELGIQHKSLKETLRTYEEEIESDFGRLRFETATAPEHGGIGEIFCWLNEEQAFYVMTLSRNTDQVREAKRHLVTAFKKAREALITGKPAELENKLFGQIMLKLGHLEERTKKLDDIEEASSKHKGARAVIDADIAEEDSVEDSYLSVDQYLLSRGLIEVERTQLNAIRRRAASFFKTDKHKEPHKINGRCVYRGSEIEYIRQAIRSVIDI